jgi:Secretion system C-terminal sorting domain
MKKSLFVNICLFSLSINQLCAQIYWGDLWVQHQWQLDTLQQYDSIAGYLSIGVLPPAISDIHDLSKLKHLKAVEGDMAIVSTSLTNLSGLDSLEDVGVHVIDVSDNPYLKNLDGLGKIRLDYKNFCCEFYINNNPELERLTHFIRLDTTKKIFQIANNPKLSTLKGLDSLVRTNLSINGGVFKNLDGLQGVKLGGVGISNAGSLVSVRDLRMTEMVPQGINGPPLLFSGIGFSNCTSLKTIDYRSDDILSNCNIGITNCEQLKDLHFINKLQNVGVSISANPILESLQIDEIDTLHSFSAWKNPQLQQLYLTQQSVLGQIGIVGNPRLKQVYLTGGDPVFEPADTLYDPFNKKQLLGYLNIYDNDSLLSIHLPDYNVAPYSAIILHNNKQLEQLFAPKFSPNLVIDIWGNNLKKIDLPGIHGKLKKGISIKQSATDSLYYASNQWIPPSTNEIDTILGIGNYQSCGYGVEIRANTRYISDFNQEYFNTDPDQAAQYDVALYNLRIEKLRFPNLRTQRKSIGGFQLPNLKDAPIFLSLEKNQTFKFGTFGSHQLQSLDSLQTINVDTISIFFESNQLVDCDVICEWRSKGYQVNYLAKGAQAPCDSIQHIIQYCIISTTEPQQVDVEVYPNPASTQLFIIHHQEKIMHLWLINAQGAVVRRLEPELATAQMQLNGLEKGLYFLMGRDASGGSFQRKIMILGEK